MAPLTCLIIVFKRRFQKYLERVQISYIFYVLARSLRQRRQENVYDFPDDYANMKYIAKYKKQTKTNRPKGCPLISTFLWSLAGSKSNKEKNSSQLVHAGTTIYGYINENKSFCLK